MTDRPIDRWKRATAGAPSRLLKPKYRKPHVARGPVATADAATVARAQAEVDWEQRCKCGFLVCSKRGPCAPMQALDTSRRYGKSEAMQQLAELTAGKIIAAPKPSPAPVVERRAHRFVVGQRVRYIAGIACGHIPAGVITRLWSDREVWWKDDDGTERSTLVEHLEPVEPLTSERGAQESDGALLERCGWHERGFPGRAQYAHGGDDSCVAHVWKILGENDWRWHPKGTFIQAGAAPTLLQAACAALGIRIVPDDDMFVAVVGEGRNSAWPDGARAYKHAESCARAAVEAWSAMQREGSDGK